MKKFITFSLLLNISYLYPEESRNEAICSICGGYYNLTKNLCQCRKDGLESERPIKTINLTLGSTFESCPERHHKYEAVCSRKGGYLVTAIARNKIESQCRCNSSINSTDFLMIPFDDSSECPLEYHRDVIPGRLAEERIKLNCYNQNWTNKQCRFIDLNDHEDSILLEDYYDDYLLLSAGDDFGRGVLKVISSIGEGVLRAVNMIDDDLIVPYRRDGWNVRAQIKRGLREYQSSHQLNDCQKSCLVKCLTNQILREHRFNLRTKFGNTPWAYLDGTGECTEFSRVADELNHVVGVSSRTSSGAGTSTSAPFHAFNKVKIDGEWFFSEPQNENCHFFYRGKETATSTRAILNSARTAKETEEAVTRPHNSSVIQH